jgi:membrane protein involved in colicin uptake
MSLAEIERFAADLKSNEALRAEAGKAQAEKSRANPMARAVAFAASKGYAFTVDEARAHAKARARANGKELTDADLDGIAGGNGSGCSIRFSLCVGGIAGSRAGMPDGFH